MTDEIYHITDLPAGTTIDAVHSDDGFVVGYEFALPDGAHQTLCWGAKGLTLTETRLAADFTMEIGIYDPIAGRSADERGT